MSNDAQLQGYKGPTGAEHVCVNDALVDLEIEAVDNAKRRIGNGADRIKCDCPECCIHGTPIALHRAQDCRYAMKRSELVGQALEIALEKCDGSNEDFTRVFSVTMDELSAPLLR